MMSKEARNLFLNGGGEEALAAWKVSPVLQCCCRLSGTADRRRHVPHTLNSSLFSGTCPPLPGSVPAFPALMCASHPPTK